jgi:hypothetical protein
MSAEIRNPIFAPIFTRVSEPRILGVARRPA